MNPLTHVLCGGLAGPADAGDSAVRLDRRPGGNLYLDEDQLLSPLMAPPSDALRDLLDIAAYVYAADQLAERGRRRTPDGDACWRRSFHFHIPLREPDRWTPEGDGLAELLGFLSDDDYRFTFAPGTDSSVQARIAFGDTPFVEFDDVALFSGGLDSLAGAARLIADGRRPLLVTHRPIDKVAGRQRRLLDGLRQRAGDRRPFHLTVRVNKDSELTRENTQRSRSFLYAALGGLMAATAGKDRLLMFENGVLSLNLPPSGAVVGARATRTTHPRVMAGFGRLLTHAAGRPFAVENPFHDLTKTEVVRELVAAGGREWIRWSTSCVHTWQMSERVAHCGECSQCIDRRFAVLAAGEADADPADGYRVGLETAERGPESAGLLAGYVEQATEIGRMENPVAFFARYGEAIRALGDGPEPLDRAAERVYRLYHRHASQVNGVVERAIAAHPGELRERTLPPSCLVRLVCSDPPQVETITEPAPPTAAYLFARHAQGWRVRFKGGRELILIDQKGLGYLQHLLTHPGLPVDAVTLSPDRVVEESEQTNTDRQGLAALNDRVAELDVEIEKAKANGDAAQEAIWQAELDAVLARVRADTRPGGKLKKLKGGREKQRDAVRIAIRRACATIAEFDPALGAHLNEPHLTLGMTLMYCPPDGVAWQTD